MADFQTDVGGVIFKADFVGIDQSLHVTAEFMGPNGPMKLKRRQLIRGGFSDDDRQEAFEEAVAILLPQVNLRLNQIMGNDILEPDEVIDRIVMRERREREARELVEPMKAHQEKLEAELEAYDLQQAEEAAAQANPLWGQF